MIGKVTRGSDVGGLLRYLYGPGRANEHTDPHLAGPLGKSFDVGDRRWWTARVSDRADAARPVIRTAVAADLPTLQQVYKAASLSNAGDAPLLLARPEFLVFAGDGIAEGRTRVATTASVDGDRLLGFATVAVDPHGGLELEDLFVDPEWRRRGIARQLVLDAVGTARQAGHQRLSVTGNPHALAFYLTVGFVGAGQAATELGRGLRMHLDLTPT